MIAATAFGLCAVSTHAAQVLDWQAASGLLPDQISPAWTLIDSATIENPALVGGVLTLSTSVEAENMAYIQTEPLIDTVSPFYIEARVRYVSGFSSSAARAPIIIGLTTAPNIGNILFIGEDEVFFNVANHTAGAKISVDTNDAFHTYRIEYDGAGGLNLLYDGGAILTGSTFDSAPFNGSQQRIFWGEASLLTYGVSEWISVEHNALVPIPAAIWLFASAFAGLGWMQRKRT